VGKRDPFGGLDTGLALRLRRGGAVERRSGATWLMPTFDTGGEVRGTAKVPELSGPAVSVRTFGRSPCD